MPVIATVYVRGYFRERSRTAAVHFFSLHVLARLSSSGDNNAAVDGKHGHFELVLALILCHMRFGVDAGVLRLVTRIRLSTCWFVASKCVGCTVVLSVSLRCVLACCWFQKALFYVPGSALVKSKH